MPKARFTFLENRTVIGVDGDDARPFLQGLISNDVHRLGPDRALYAAFLTPQGKYLFDFFLIDRDGAILIDCEAERAADFRKRLALYRLRSKVAIKDRSDDFTVAAVFGEDAFGHLGLVAQAGTATALDGGVAFVDPRLAEVGARAVLPAGSAAATLTGKGLAPVGFEEYDARRIALGLPDGSRDMTVDKTTLLEAGFEELHGVDFAKGCYMGQELTARMKYRGLVKRRLVPVKIDGPAPPPGTPIVQDDKEVGEMRSSGKGRGMALMRIEHIAKAGIAPVAFAAGQATVVPEKPAWANF